MTDAVEQLRDRYGTRAMQAVSDPPGRYLDCGLRAGAPEFASGAQDAADMPTVLAALRDATDDPDVHLPCALADLQTQRFVGLRYRLLPTGIAVSERTELTLPFTVEPDVLVVQLRGVRRELNRARLAARFGAEFADDYAIGHADRWVLAHRSRAAGVFPDAGYTERDLVPGDAAGLLIDLEADELMLEPLNEGGGSLLWSAPDPELLAGAG